MGFILLSLLALAARNNIEELQGSQPVVLFFNETVELKKQHRRTTRVVLAMLWRWRSVLGCCRKQHRRTTRLCRLLAATR